MTMRCAGNLRRLRLGLPPYNRRTVGARVVVEVKPRLAGRVAFVAAHVGATANTSIRQIPARPLLSATDETGSFTGSADGLVSHLATPISRLALPTGSLVQLMQRATFTCPPSTRGIAKLRPTRRCSPHRRQNSNPGWLEIGAPACGCG